MKLNYKRTFLVGLAFLSICAFWQMYDNIVPLILQGTFHLNETLTGAIMAADNVLAVFLLPLLGSLSDKADTRWGKRTPFIVVGTVLAVVLMMLLPHADKTGNFVLFVISLFFLLIAMGLYRSPAVALMPDLTPKPLRSQANAIIDQSAVKGRRQTGLYAGFSGRSTSDGGCCCTSCFDSAGKEACAGGCESKSGRRNRGRTKGGQDRGAYSGSKA